MNRRSTALISKHGLKGGNCRTLSMLQHGGDQPSQQMAVHIHAHNTPAKVGSAFDSGSPPDRHALLPELLAVLKPCALGELSDGCTSSRRCCSLNGTLA